MQTEKKYKLRRKDKVQIAFMRLGIAFLRLLGFRGIRALGQTLGFLTWHFIPQRRNYATEAVQQHLNIPRVDAKRIAKASFGHSFTSFMEAALVKNFHLSHNKHLLPIDEHVEKLLQEERPVVATTAHLGGWELLAGLLPEVKPDKPQVVVVRRQKNRAANALIFSLRGSTGGDVVGHRNAAPVVLNVLRQNGTTAFLVDHNAIRKEGIFVPFLGEPASVNIGPAMLALRAKAKVYPIFLIRHPKYVYELIARPPLDTTLLEGNIQERVRQIAEFYTKAVEDIVREYPEQWFWMHKRWRTKLKKNSQKCANFYKH